MLSMTKKIKSSVTKKSFYTCILGDWPPGSRVLWQFQVTELCPSEIDTVPLFYLWSREISCPSYQIHRMNQLVYVTSHPTSTNIELSVQLPCRQSSKGRTQRFLQKKFTLVHCSDKKKKFSQQMYYGSNSENSYCIPVDTNLTAIKSVMLSRSSKIELGAADAPF